MLGATVLATRNEPKDAVTVCLRYTLDKKEKKMQEKASHRHRRSVI
jgi:hypothetical protein